MLSSNLDSSIHLRQTFLHQSKPISLCSHTLDLILPKNMAFQYKYSSHVPQISPKSFREGRHGPIEQKKTGLPIGKDRKKRDVIESSIVSSLQYPKGIHGKQRVAFKAIFFHKAQYVVCSSHSIEFVCINFLPHPWLSTFQWSEYELSQLSLGPIFYLPKYTTKVRLLFPLTELYISL